MLVKPCDVNICKQLVTHQSQYHESTGLAHLLTKALQQAPDLSLGIMVIVLRYAIRAKYITSITLHFQKSCSYLVKFFSIRT